MKRIFIVAVLILASLAVFSQEMKFGVRVEEDQYEAAAGIVSAAKSDPGNPVMLTVVMKSGWESAPLNEPLTGLLEKAAASGYLVSLTVPVPKNEEESRLYSLVKISESAKKYVNSFELIISKGDFSQYDLENPQQMSFTLKRLVASLRGDSKARIYLGSLDSDFVSMLEPLYKEDLSAYVDGYATFEVGGYGDPQSDVRDFVEKNHVGAPLRLHLPKVKSSLGAQTISMLSLSKGAKEVDVQIEGIEEGFKDLLYLRKAIPGTMLAGYAVEGVQLMDGAIYRSDIAVLPFLDSDEMLQGFLIAPNTAKSAPGSLSLHLSTADITEPKTFPLPSGESKALGYKADQKKGIADLNINWEGKPQFILMERLRTGTIGSDKMTVTGTYKIPVELIIARHQATEQAQLALLQNYTADAEVNYHFKVPGTSGSLDVTFVNQFLYDKVEGARWIQKDLLVNGVKWKGKKIPDLPIVEPEKINTLPLILTLSRNYSYHFIKEELFDGRACYVVEFVPVAGAKIQDVSGRVWIDKENYVKRQIQIVQKNMTPPQVSNEEFDKYSFIETSGRQYNMLTFIRAQQIFTVIGQTVTGEKEVRFANVVVNDPQFESKLDLALKSDAPILQDTDKGYKYLEKQADGTRAIRWEEKTGRLAAVGGAYYDKSLDYPIPVLGVDYFDYNYKKKNIQVNMFLAGPVDSVSVSKAEILPRVDAALSGVGFLVSFNDRYYEHGLEQKDEELKYLTELIFGSLGYRVTEFSKLKLTLSGKYQKFSKAKDTAVGYEFPKSHVDLGYGLSYDYSRKGWQAAGSVEGHSRSSWENWGYGFSADEISKTKKYLLWETSFGKTFYLPNFQKIGVALSYLDGKDLDRFSKYKFTYMGSQSLSGFTGSGIRFDKGAIGKVLYAFDIANIIRFSANIDFAKVKQNRNDSNWQKHTGLGFSGSVAGPWSTFWSLNLGYALQSDIPEVKHDATVALVVMKLWTRDGLSFRKKK
jgi:hypothetical protein